MPRDTNLSLGEALLLYEAHLARRPISDNTRKAFLGDAHIFARFVQPPADDAPGVPVRQIATGQIKAFLADQERGGVASSPKSIERRLTSIKVFFKWLHATGHIGVDPAEGVAYQLFLDPLPEYLSEAEVQAAILAARALAASQKCEMRPLTAILLVLDTGLKKGECLKLVVSDLVLDAPGSPIVRIRYEEKKLQFKDRSLPLTEDCARAVRDHLERYECREALFDCTGRNLEYLFNRKVAPAAGLAALTFEMLRWTCAVRDFRFGGMTDDQMQLKYGLSPIGWGEMQAKLERLTRLPGS